MTDTQEAMRTECNHFAQQQGMTPNEAPEWMWEMWQEIAAKCTAQSAEKIARLDRENVALTLDLMRTQDKLAASELSNRQLKEALTKILAEPQESFSDSKAVEYMVKYAKKALAQQTSTEALDAYVDEEIKRRQDVIRRFNDCLPQFKGDVMHPPAPDKE